MRTWLRLMLSSMENFTIREQIGQGAQATVYLVERLTDKQQFVLKKVECFDESEANKAFKEAVDLRDLQHVYVSGYREFFVLWEQQDSSVFICILMDYFPQGNLETVLSKYRENKEVIDEELIMQWLGQIIEALIYVHKKRIIHRDVRPTNIYLQTDDTLCLGDFGVNTIMGDAITCTRATEASMNYMAPEVCQEGYTEKSDVWSLGCVLFELVTTFLYDRDEAISKLKEIRGDPSLLDEIFEEISKHYSDSLISVLGSMLKVTSKQRPLATDLLNNKFIIKCVQMSDSTQLEKRKRLKSASSSKDDKATATESTEDSRWPVPRNQGVYKVLEYLASMVDYENCVKDALCYLLELAKSEEGLLLDPKGKKLVAMAMKNNMTVKDIQVTGFNVLNSLVMGASGTLELRELQDADTSDVLFSADIIGVIPLAMENHKDNLDVQYAASTLLVSLAANSRAGDIIGQLGGVHDVLIALKTHSQDAGLCSVCLNALWGLTVHGMSNEEDGLFRLEDGNNVKIATEEEGIKEVCNVLQIHMNSSDVAEAACATLLALSLDEDNLELICDLDAVGLLVSTVKTHSKNPKVVKNACLALASLVEIDEESAYRVLTNEGPGKTHIAGVPIIIKTYETHKDNAEVVESIVTLLMELAEYDDVCINLIMYNLPEHLEEVVQRYGSMEDIIGPCEKALDRLRNVKKPEIPPTPSPDISKFSSTHKEVTQA